MGRLCVILVRRDPRTTVVAMHIEHRNRQSSVTQLLQNNVGSVLYFDAFAESTLCVSWTADADVLRDTKKDFICLDDLYMGNPTREVVGDDEMELELIGFDFGHQTELSRDDIEDPTNLFDNLFSQTVCDVEVLELHELTQVKSSKTYLQIKCGKNSQSVARMRFVDSSSSCARCVQKDCSFVVCGALPGAAEEVETEEGGPVLITFALFETRAGRDLLVGAATLDLRTMHHIKSSKYANTPLPFLYIPLLRLCERVAWVRCRLGLSVEDNGALFGSLGFATRVLPFRVNYGDLILVSNHSTMGRIISAATSSEWDHVAVVTCDASGRELMLMEATSDGVLVYPFEERVGAVLRTDALLGVRRLITEKRDTTALALFVRAHCGKSYEDSIVSMIRAKFKSNKEEDLSTIFCSELIAACYKHLGLLSQSQNASNFTPKDFANAHVMMNDGELGVIRKYSLRSALTEHDISDAMDPVLRKGSAKSASDSQLSPPVSPRVHINSQFVSDHARAASKSDSSLLKTSQDVDTKKPFSRTQAGSPVQLRIPNAGGDSGWKRVSQDKKPSSGSIMLGRNSSDDARKNAVRSSGGEIKPDDKKSSGERKMFGDDKKSSGERNMIEDKKSSGERTVIEDKKSSGERNIFGEDKKSSGERKSPRLVRRLVRTSKEEFEEEAE